MTAVPEIRGSGPVVPFAGRSQPRTGPARIVAVADTLTELRRPESDLARILAGVGTADLLVACDDVVSGRPAPAAPTPLFSYLDYPDYDDPDLADAADEWVAPAPRAPGPDERVSGDDVLELPGVHLHRLGLRGVTAGSEDDLVAAMSELVGFDPEPGVYCLAPVASADDPSRAVLISAMERIAQVYGLPMLRYRCLELSIVPCKG
ncbi:MAG: hypothetical protein J0I34_10535 [Pseudonocardia sp.]|uniref:hypothetical protein n=1 Tax=unclassified Pseudonocardia TaxID=2619320 RepID=UPI00086C99A5|nr:MULTISPECIES: hypothetical protein [unclassified Pseudonocardia]MBN9109211.1 hypothetical protein [Pseudonocardia sp.]ODU12191.1 MAG: hypothetical protein ABS80_22275 [Pseudonocardia sp. SCN 72-51]ODV01500.1 MAG: hypothetical protein ABT15_27585 [Pseudonocardia sp. SCN 73-27]